MGENRSLLVKFSMTFGLYMGIYWLFKYLFSIWGLKTPSMGAIYWGLTLAVPFIAYKFTRQYRLLIGGKIGFLHAWQFGFLLYLFASLIVSLEHYIFYRYIAPPEFLSDTLIQAMEVLKQTQLEDKIVDSMENIHITPIQMAIQGIFSNVFYGIVLSLPIAGIVSRGQDTPPSNSNDNID